MKKIKLLGTISIFCFLLSGCGNGQVLSCSMTQEQSGATMKQTVDITFKKEEVSKVKMAINTKVTDDVSDSNWNSLVDMLDEQYSTVNKEGFQISKVNNKKERFYNITINVDVNKAKEDDLAEYDLEGLAGASGTYKEIKEQMEKSGLTCE